MASFSRRASAVIRLESSPPDRKVETGTSAIRWAETESSRICASSSASMPWSRWPSSSTGSKYRCTCNGRPGSFSAQQPAGSFSTPRTAQWLSGTQ